jgi:SMI1/KNR4 family protein SUKH-1
MEVEDLVKSEIAVLVQRTFGFFPDPSALVSDSELEAAEYELGVKLPQSYRTFLRYFGGEYRCCQEFFGMPRDGLWGDIVLMNEADRPGRPPGLVKFAMDDDGGAYYLDTTHMDAEGECPVVRLDRANRKLVAASNFIEFFHALAAGRA